MSLLPVVLVESWDIQDNWCRLQVCAVFPVVLVFPIVLVPQVVLVVPVVAVV